MLRFSILFAFGSRPTFIALLLRSLHFVFSSLHIPLPVPIAAFPFLVLTLHNQLPESLSCSQALFRNRSAPSLYDGPFPPVHYIFPSIDNPSAFSRGPVFTPFHVFLRPAVFPSEVRYIPAPLFVFPSIRRSRYQGLSLIIGLFFSGFSRFFFCFLPFCYSFSARSSPIRSHLLFPKQPQVSDCYLLL